MKLLLTGASGFVGRNLLLRAPASWRIVAQYATDATFPEFLASLNRQTVTPIRCSLDNKADIEELVRLHGSDWDGCVYLAAKVDIPWSVKNPREDLLANTVPLINLLEALHTERLIYFSSGAVYDGLHGEVSPSAPVAPSLPYAISKLASERYVECYQRRRHSIGQYLIVRFFGAYGPYEASHKIYTQLIRTLGLASQDHYTIYGDGTNLIDAMHVDDAVEAIQRMLAGSHWNTIVNLAAGHPLSVEELVRQVGRALGRDAVRIEKQGTANERNEFWGSVREMQEAFGFSPKIDLASGIRSFRDFLAQRHAR